MVKISQMTIRKVAAHKYAFFELTPFDTKGDNYYSFKNWAKEKANETAGALVGGTVGAASGLLTSLPAYFALRKFPANYKYKDLLDPEMLDLFSKAKYLAPISLGGLGFMIGGAEGARKSLNKTEQNTGVNQSSRKDIAKRSLRSSIFGPYPTNDYLSSRVIFKEKNLDNLKEIVNNTANSILEGKRVSAIIDAGKDIAEKVSK